MSCTFDVTWRASLHSTIKSLEETPWKVLDDSSTSLKELAHKIFSDESVSSFLIHASRLPVFSKEMARSFRSDVVSLALIKQLKYFYNQPTVAVLQQLSRLVSRNSSKTNAASGWDKILKRFAGCSLGTTSVHRLLQDVGRPDCYEKNAEYLEQADPHAVYPTSIYRICDGYVAASTDGSVIESTMSTTLTTTIKIVRNVLDPTNPELKNVYQPLGRCVAVIDDKVEKLYGDKIQAYFDSHFIALEKLVFSGNEVDKDISIVENLLVSFRKKRVSRNDPVLVIGGGVISDIAGFATALYHRNTPYVMLCTSIVSGIDAGPSPRTCCDGFGFKNLYGCYHPPVLTLTDRTFFRTLHYGCLRHGIAEIVKMAVVKDEELFNLLEKVSSTLMRTKFGTEMSEFQGNHEAFEEVCDLVIGKALEGYVRAEYGNLWETHQCRPHAYGHTWSPGYELPAGMLHGHAVATGMGFGAYLSFCEDWISQQELDRVMKLISDLELSLWHPVMEDTQTIYKAQEKMIEKRGGNLVAPVPKGLGHCGYLNHMPFDLLRQRLGEYREICLMYPREGLGVEAHCRDVGLEDPATVRDVNNNKELPREAIQSGSDKGIPQKKELSYGDWIDVVQKKRTKGTPYGIAFRRAQDTTHPPNFEPNELFHSGVEDYAIDMTQLPSPDVQQIAIATEQQQLFMPCMVGQIESQFLKMTSQLSNAKRVLDVGTFTGMSAMAFAEGIPSDGEVVTIEFDPKIAAVADRLFCSSAQTHKITLKVGDAVDIMKDLKSAGEKFDIVFLDAAKEQYILYYKVAKDILTSTGFILADNSLCALLYGDEDPRRQALHDFNQMVKNDASVEQLVLPIREGISIIRPRNN